MRLRMPPLAERRYIVQTRFAAATRIDIGRPATGDSRGVLRLGTACIDRHAARPGPTQSAPHQPSAGHGAAAKVGLGGTHCAVSWAAPSIRVRPSVRGGMTVGRSHDIDHRAAVQRPLLGTLKQIDGRPSAFGHRVVIDVEQRGFNGDQREPVVARTTAGIP